MKRYESDPEIILERDPDAGNEERLLAAFDMLFTGIEVLPLDNEAFLASPKEPI